MKIAITAYMGGRGGVSRQLSMLANILSSKHHEVYLIALVHFNPCFQLSSNIKVVNLTDVENKSRVKILNRFFTFRKALKEIRPDFCINYNLQGAYFCAVLPKKYTGKVIYSERGDPYDDEYAGTLGKVRALTLPRIDGFVFQSEGARDFFDEKVKSRSVVIHNPVSVPIGKYAQPTVREKRIINIGRLHHQKNQALMIEAFAKIASDFPAYTLEIYGDGELQQPLEEQIDALGLKERIIIYPSRKDIFDVLVDSSLHVLSSDFEGMPNVLMEAMALGVPSISTDCRPGGARTLVTDGVDGFITPLRDADALADKMRWILSHPVEAEEMGRKAMSIMDTHQPKMIYDQWDEFLKKLK